MDLCTADADPRAFQFLGPDANETVTRVCLEFCDECHRWYNRR